MNKKHFLVSLAAVLIGAGPFLLSVPNASAACAAVDQSRGTATMPLTIPSDGTYTVWSRIKAPDTTNNSFYLSIDSTVCNAVVGDAQVPANTWTWVNYQAGSSTNKLSTPLTAGSHTVVVTGREDNVELDRIILTTDSGCVPVDSGANCVTVPPAPTPYSGTAAAIPGTVQAENYDNGGEGVAYHDSDPQNTGNTYRTTEGVDIKAVANSTAANYQVGWTNPGEYLSYSTNVTAAGSYVITAKVGSTSAGGTFHVEFDGVDVTGPMIVQNTGSWSSFADVSKTVTLSAGKHTMKLVFDSYNSGTNVMGDVDALVITPVPVADSTPPVTTITAPANNYSASGTLNVNANASDNVGVSRVDLLIDGAVAATSSAAPYSFALPTTSYANGLHSFQTKAYDAANNSALSPSISVTISNAITDTIPPSVTIVSPTNGSTVTGSLTIKASAQDNVQVSLITIYVDGVQVASGNTTDLTASWNAKPQKVRKGPHTITVQAQDTAGNVTTKSVTVYK